MVTLKIKRKDFLRIKSGKKTDEFRKMSKYNKSLLLCPDPSFDGKLNGNPEIKQIQFENGYFTDAPKILADVEYIRPVKFVNDIDNEDITAKAGMVAIHIKLSNIAIT